MDEDFLDVYQSSHKKVFFFVILIVIVILMFGYFFVFQKYNFEVKTINLELGHELSNDVNFYLKTPVVDTSGYTLDVSKVNNNSIGEYEYTVLYEGKTLKGKVIVKDTSAPTYTLQDLTIEENDEDFYLGNVLTNCEDFSKPCLVSFVNEKDADKISTPGTYSLKIKIADIYGNHKIDTAKITVVKKGTLSDDNNDLEYASSDMELENFKNEYYLKLTKPYEKDSIEVTGFKDEISMIDWQSYANTTYPDYTFKEVQIITVYNKDGFVIGFAVDLCLNGTSGEMRVYVTKKVEIPLAELKNN